MSSTPVSELSRFSVQTQDDIVNVRTQVRTLLKALGFSLVEQTKFVTAVSEIARNAVVYGAGGRATVEAVKDRRSTGIRVVISDEGPGIEDLELARVDGYSTGGGLGLGLGGAGRLVDRLEIQSGPDGTTVRLERWKR